MAKLLAKENVPLAVVIRLRELGHEVLTMLEERLANRGMPDNQVLEEAISRGAAVLTLNRRDFMRLHRDDSNHQGIVVCTDDADFAGMAERIHATIQNSGSLHGQLIRITR